MIKYILTRLPDHNGEVNYMVKPVHDTHILVTWNHKELKRKASTLKVGESMEISFGKPY